MFEQSFTMMHLLLVSVLFFFNLVNCNQHERLQELQTILASRGLCQKMQQLLVPSVYERRVNTRLKQIAQELPIEILTNLHREFKIKAEAGINPYGLPRAVALSALLFGNICATYVALKAYPSEWEIIMTASASTSIISSVALYQGAGAYFLWRERSHIVQEELTKRRTASLDDSPV